MAYAEPVNQTGLDSMFTYANSVTNNIFGVGILISLYLIIVLVLRNRGAEISDCMVAAGYTTSFAAIFLLMLGLINSWQLFMTFMMTVIPALWSLQNK